jgi:hypothetical protein
VYVRHSEGEWARHNIYVPFNGVWWYVPGGPVCVKNRNAAGFFHAQPFSMCIKTGPTPKEFSQLDTNVGSIGVNMGQHPSGTLSTPCGAVAPAI